MPYICDEGRRHESAPAGAIWQVPPSRLRTGDPPETTVVGAVVAWPSGGSVTSSAASPANGVNPPPAKVTVHAPPSALGVPASGRRSVNDQTVGLPKSEAVAL